MIVEGIALVYPVKVYLGCCGDACSVNGKGGMVLIGNIYFCVNYRIVIAMVVYYTG